MKVAIYTIALNELQFVQPWYDSAKEADYLLIADTGSTDGTIEAAKELGNIWPLRNHGGTKQPSVSMADKAFAEHPKKNYVTSLTSVI